jgi:hypothetical protein
MVNKFVDWPQNVVAVHYNGWVWCMSFVSGFYSWLDECAVAWLLKENNIFIHVRRTAVMMKEHQEVVP